MRALVFDGSLKLVDKHYSPLLGECSIAVSYAGICNTDLEITAGYMGFHGVLGHEFVGVVNEGPADWLGKRVVGEINVGCGVCIYCKKGLSRHCPTRSVLGILNRDGAMAEKVSLPAANLHELPETISDIEATFIEPLAAACEILEQLNITASDRVCIIGDGKLAILIARVLALTGTQITAVGHHMQKLAMMPVASRLLESDFNAGDSFDFVVEASGSPNGWELATNAVRSRGVIVLKSTYAGPFDFNPAPLVIREISVVGSRCGLFAPAIQLLKEKSVYVDDLVSNVFPLGKAVEAFSIARQSDVLKVLLKI